jgi:hypothetical protein
MQEIRSTDSLDKEILDDAQKKAAKILKAADDSAKSTQAKWERRLVRALDDVKKRCEKELAQAESEIASRLILDKRRIEADTTEKSLLAATNTFFSTVSHSQMVALLQRELSVRMQSLSPDETRGGNADVTYRGITRDEAEALLKAACLQDASSPAATSAQAAAPGLSWQLHDSGLHEGGLREGGSGNGLRLTGSLPALVVDLSGVRVTASLDAAAASILLDNREELVAALL